jgi:hypothetical protein
VTKSFLLRFLIAVDLAYAITLAAGMLTHITRRFRAILKFHQQIAYVFLFLFLGYVAAIEVHVRSIGGSIFDRELYIHLAVAFPWFLVSLALIFKLNGIKSRYHWLLAYLSILLMIGTNVTGIPLIRSRF